jgi:tyrosyl-tRNA synthetase
MPILVGLDGQRKMSKSLGNYVGITEAPSEMFGKLMSVSDEMMWPYFDLLTDHTPEEIAWLLAQVKSGAAHPMDVKMSLAQEIIAGFHGAEAAAKAAAEFQRIFRDREAPEEAPVRKLACGEAKRLTALLVELDLAASRSEADRLVKQGGVELAGERVSDVKAEVDLAKPREFLLRAGKKKFLRVVVE